MNRTKLALVGAGSAIILSAMFIFLFLIPVFFSPLLTINPISERDLDPYNRLILTGTTTLPEKSFLEIIISPVPENTAQDPVGKPSGARGYINVMKGGKTNLWKGVVDLSSLKPGIYSVSVVTIELTKNYTKIESPPLVIRQVILGDETAGSGTIRKRPPDEQPFIRINPPDEIAPGKGWRFSGITSLEPGSTLIWQLFGDNSSTTNTSSMREGVAHVIRGTEGINRWSVLPGSLQSLPVNFRIRVLDSRSASSAGLSEGVIRGESVFNQTILSLEKGNTGHEPEHYITIDAMPEMRRNGVYILSGTTSLSPGSELDFSVLPYSSGMEISLMIDPITKSQVSRNPFSGTTGFTTVIEGDGSANLWTLMLETYLMEPGLYAVQIRNDQFDPSTNKFISAGVNTSRIFALQEQLS